MINQVKLGGLSNADSILENQYLCKANFRNDSLIKALTPLLNHPRRDVRASVVSALGMIDDPSAIPAVLQAFKKFPRPSFKNAPLDYLNPDLAFDGQSYRILLKLLQKLGYNATLADTWSKQEKQDMIVVLKQSLDYRNSQRPDINDFRTHTEYCQLASTLADLGISGYLDQCFALAKDYAVHQPEISFSSEYTTPNYISFHPEYKISKLDRVFTDFLPSNVSILNLLRTHALQHRDVEVRRASLFAWIGQSKLPEIYTNDLIKALKDPDEFVRAMAAYYLSNASTIKEGSDPKIEHALTDALNDKNQYVKLHARTGLFKTISYQKAYALKSLEKSQKSNIRFSSADLANIANLIAKNELQDSRIAPRIISQLRFLNVTKDIPVEDWYQSSLRKLPEGLAGKITHTTDDNNDRIRSEGLQILQLLADRNLLTEADRQAALPILMSISKIWEQYESPVGRIQIAKLIRQINQSVTSDPIAQQRTQWFFYIEAGFLGLVGLTSLSLLLINLRLRNPFPFFWSGYLIFPEEVIAELIALVQRRHSEKVPRWRIKLEIIYEVLLLLWAFQIVIRIDNIKLPPGGNRSAK